jgi:hypothetical protein
MGMIRIYQEKSKGKKKPGWQKEQEEYQKWLDSVKSQTLGAARKNRAPQPKAKAVPVVEKPVIRKVDQPAEHSTSFGAGTKAVPRPEIMYKDDPEMLARELAARARQFNVAPAYNKGPTIYVSDDEITNQLVGGRRR